MVESHRSLDDLGGLPDEVLLHIISFLDSPDLQRLQSVSKRLKDIGRDDSFWKQRCLSESSFLSHILHIRALYGDSAGVSPESEPASDAARLDSESSAKRKQKDRVKIMANWDPSYPAETVSWYDEYIQRNAPLAVNWFQQPQIRDGAVTGIVEARGVALYRPNHDGTLLAVAPLDDGSVCLWNVASGHERRGAVVAKSAPGILFIDGPSADNSRRSKRIDSGVTECVSVDSARHIGYFAVQGHLIEVDLRSLSVIGCESFPWSITSLSEADPAVPLTVGTNLGIHLHDSRVRRESTNDISEIVDTPDRMSARDFYERSVKDIFDPTPPPPYAPLAQPGPLSILHPLNAGGQHGLSEEIYVAGRFSNILRYDRRKFPSIMGSIHSGARLCAMTSLPYPFSALDADLRRRARMTPDQIYKSKSTPGGRTIVACGEYNTKGSLEMYGLCPPATVTPNLACPHNSVLKNRQTSSRCKLLSVVNHGTRLVVSDGLGQVKWLERDGVTEVRRIWIGSCDREQGPSLFPSMPGPEEMARKLLATKQPQERTEGINTNDILFWTGEKLGLLSFSSKPGFTIDDFETSVESSPEETAQAEEERAYSDRMRRALERQADDVRFVRNLGVGSGHRG